eukprot:9201967-Pyramimonas_sp.AAC.1
MHIWFTYTHLSQIDVQNYVEGLGLRGGEGGRTRAVKATPGRHSQERPDQMGLSGRSGPESAARLRRMEPS